MGYEELMSERGDKCHENGEVGAASAFWVAAELFGKPADSKIARLRLALLKIIIASLRLSDHDEADETIRAVHKLASDALW